MDGGFDSTYRLGHLFLVEGRDVQSMPSTSNRGSTRQKLRTLSRIRDQVEQRAGDPAVAHPHLLHARLPLAEKHVARRWQSLRDRTSIAKQYGDRAAIAEYEGLEGVELSMERHPGGPTDLQEAIFMGHEHGPTLRNDADDAKLFQYWSFPLIDITEHEMLHHARAQGFDDVLMMRWFCYRPVGSHACGVSKPCRIVKRDQMTEGFTFIPRPVQWLWMLTKKVRLASHEIGLTRVPAHSRPYVRD